MRWATSAGAWVCALAPLVLLAGRPAELVAVATVAVAALLAAAVAASLVLALTATGDRPASARDASLREHARRTGVLRQRDPDAPGRQRPRAPSAHPSAA